MYRVFLALILFFTLFHHQFCLAAENFARSCRCERCGNYDFSLRDDALHVHYDHCARGGYGSHPVATYERRDGGWARIRHIDGPAPLWLSPAFTCREYCGGSACRLSSEHREKVWTERGRTELFELARSQCGSGQETFRGESRETVRFHFFEKGRDVANPAYNRPDLRFHLQCFRLPASVVCLHHRESR